MNFQTGDRVYWNSHPLYVGTVVGVSVNRLGVRWDHMGHNLLWNLIELHTLIVKRDDYDGFEADA